MSRLVRVKPSLDPSRISGQRYWVRQPDRIRVPWYACFFRTSVSDVLLMTPQSFPHREMPAMGLNLDVLGMSGDDTTLVRLALFAS